MPLTAVECVKRVYTDLAVIDVTPRGFEVVGMVPGITFDDLQARTGAKLHRQPQAQAAGVKASRKGRGGDDVTIATAAVGVRYRAAAPRFASPRPRIASRCRRSTVAKIKSVKTGHYRIPLEVALSELTHGVMTAFEIVTLRVRDDDGAEGVGYTYTMGANGGATRGIA